MHVLSVKTADTTCSLTSLSSIEAYVPLTFFFVFVINTGISASSPELEAFV